MTHVVHTACRRTCTFNWLPLVVKENLAPWGTTTMLADRSGFPVYGKTELLDRNRNSPFSMEFLVSRISDEAILRMAFLAGQKWMLSLDKGILAWQGNTIPLLALQPTTRKGGAGLRQTSFNTKITCGADGERHLRRYLCCSSSYHLSTGSRLMGTTALHKCDYDATGKNAWEPDRNFVATGRGTDLRK